MLREDTFFEQVSCMYPACIPYVSDTLSQDTSRYIRIHQDTSRYSVDSQRTAEELKVLVKEEKVWLRGVLDTTVNIRLSVKRFKAKDREYGYGYEQ